MRCGQNGMGARREVQSIRALLTSRVTQPTPVRPRRVEQVPSGLPDGCHPRSGMPRTIEARSCAQPIRSHPHERAPAPRSGARRNPKGWDAFRARRCCSLLVWAHQTSSLAPSRSSKIVSIAHVNDYEIGSRSSRARPRATNTSWLPCGRASSGHRVFPADRAEVDRVS